MSDEERALRELVLERPDDDEPRLLYATWCGGQPDEATRAREPFIRVQLDLAQPGGSVVYTLRQQDERLRFRYGRIWGEELLPLVEDFRFDRGFVELVRCTASQFLRAAGELRARAPIRHLDLTEAGDALQELASSEQLTVIRSLSMQACGLRDEDVERFVRSPNLTSLRWLSLADNDLGPRAAAAIADSPLRQQLAYVDFNNNGYSPSEQYAHDDGFIVDSWLPPEGVALEERYGVLPWLHHRATSMADTIPDRFRAGAQDQVSAAG